MSTPNVSSASPAQTLFNTPPEEVHQKVIETATTIRNLAVGASAVLAVGAGAAAWTGVGLPEAATAAGLSLASAGVAMAADVYLSSQGQGWLNKAP